MTQHVRLATDPEFTGELTFSRAPDGSLSFGDGAAEVGDDVDVEWLVERYPNLTTDEVSDADEDGSDDGDDAEDEDEATDADEFDEMDYDQLQERAGEYDDIKGNQSADALRDALREKEA